MPDAAYNSIMTEAVAVFHDVESFEAAIDNLLAAGFDHADINVLAHEDTIASKLGPTHKSTAEFEDDPEVPRIGYIPNETIGNAEGAVIGAGVYVPAMFGGLAVAASGGTLLGVFVAAAVAGGAGGLIAAALARYIGHEHAKHLDQHLHHGGLCCGSERATPSAKSEPSRFCAVTRPMTSICTRSPSEPARRATSRESARAPFISSIANTPSTSFVGLRRGQRVMRLIFEPSRLKLYISPFGSRMKAITGLVRLSVSMEPPVPTVTTTIDPSTPTFQP